MIAERKQVMEVALAATSTSSGGNGASGRTLDEVFKEVCIVVGLQASNEYDELIRDVYVTRLLEYEL